MSALDQAASQNAEAVKQGFLHNFSIEITAKQGGKLDALRERLPQGSQVYIALIDPKDVDLQIETAEKLMNMGFNPVPHIPARLIPNLASLDNRIARFSGNAGVDHFLTLGGGLQTSGPFSSTMEMLRSGVFEKYKAKKIGFAGHPEGNADIVKQHGEAALLTALLEKQEYALSREMDAYLATQFIFSASPLIDWLREIRKQGIVLPVNVGIPGPATIKTLVKYAMMCGVGASARMIRSQALNITKLMTVSTPDDLVRDLGKARQEAPVLGIGRAHLYPFGGFDRLFDWLELANKNKS